MAQIEIQNDYQWVLNPKYGRIHTYIDGRMAGTADLGQSLVVHVAPGESHRVRVRIAWFASRSLDVMVSNGETVRLHANVRKDLNLMTGIFLMMIRPFTSLYLGEQSNV